MMDDNTPQINNEDEGPADNDTQAPAENEPVSAEPLTETSEGEVLQDETVLGINQTSCRYCRAAVPNDTTFCGRCGYPQNGTEQQRYRFKNRLSHLRDDYLHSKKRIRQARRVLYFIGGLALLLMVVFFLVAIFHNNPFMDITMQMVLSGVVFAFLGSVYIGLGLFSRKYPFPALLTGLLLYSTLFLLELILGNFNIISFIIGIAIITALTKGFLNVRKSQIAAEFLAQNPYVAERILKKK